VTLDTDDLASTQGEDAQARDWLVAMGKGNNIGEARPCVDLLVTPARSNQGTVWFEKSGLAMYDNECIPGPLKRFHGLSLNANWEKMRRPDEPTAPMIDVQVHQQGVTVMENSATRRRHRGMVD
jgi:hypothetical protein